MGKDVKSNEGFNINNYDENNTAEEIDLLGDIETANNKRENNNIQLEISERNSRLNDAELEELVDRQDGQDFYNKDLRSHLSGQVDINNLSGTIDQLKQDTHFQDIRSKDYSNYRDDHSRDNHS